MRTLTAPDSQEGAGIAKSQQAIPRPGRPEQAKLLAQQPGGHQPGRRRIEIPETVDLMTHSGNISESSPDCMGADEEPAMALTVTGIPCLSDNYFWLLQDAATGAIAVCDPGEAEPAIAAVERLGGRLDLILLTHHHGDHIGGVSALQARFGGKIVGAAADAHRLPKLDQAVRAGDTVTLGSAAGTVLDTSRLYSTGEIAILAAPVPEPETWALLLAGLGVVGWARRLRAPTKALAASLPHEPALTCSTRCHFWC